MQLKVTHSKKGEDAMRDLNIQKSHTFNPYVSRYDELGDSLS